MAESSNTVQFESGQVIIRENTPGDSAYIILSGRVEVSKRIEGQAVVLVTLGPGSIFGEMSLLDGSPRSATARAMEPTRLSVIDRRRFQTIMNAIPREVRPLFSSLSERLRNTNRLVSALSLRERLIYSVCSLINMSLAAQDGSLGEEASLNYRDTLLEICRVLAFSEDRIVQTISDLSGTGLCRIVDAPKPEDKQLVVADPVQFGCFVEFLAERLAHVPGFPVPTRKYSVLSEKAQEVLFFLKNQCGRLPRDRDGRSHYDFDRYVKEIVGGLGYGVKDAILRLQELAASGALRLIKDSPLVEGKAIVYDARDISRAQTVLLQAGDFDRLYTGLMRMGNPDPTSPQTRK